MKLKNFSRVGHNSNSQTSRCDRHKFQIQDLKFWKIFSGLKTAFIGLDNRERIIFFSLVLILSVLVVFESLKIYHGNTKLVPGFGGEYIEVISGEAKYLNPILAKTDAERTMARLIYSSLIKIDENNNPVPDLADSWEISGDGLSYTFHLRQGVSYHQGQSLDSSDVAATIAAIQNENNKSSLRDFWSTILIETPDPATVVFKLPKSYGPFIYNCTLGIVDSDDVQATLAGDYNGTGPFKYLQLAQNDNGNLEISLEANQAYYEGSPLISKIKFIICGNDVNKAAETAQDTKSVTAISAEGVNNAKFTDLSFATNRSLVLFFNMRRDFLKDIEIRKNIINKTASANPVEVKLLSLDTEPQRTRAKELADQLASQNFTINLTLLNASDFTQSVANRDYDLLLYGYSWSYDRDPYSFWHSSQLDKLNLDGYSDKNNDIAIEDARMIAVAADREAKYDQIYQKISDQFLAVYYDTEKFSYFVSGDLQGEEHYQKLARPEDRFNDILSWYLVEKRVRK